MFSNSKNNFILSTTYARSYTKKCTGELKNGIYGSTDSLHQAKFQLSPNTLGTILSHQNNC